MSMFSVGASTHSSMFSAGSSASSAGGRSRQIGRPPPVRVDEPPVGRGHSRDRGAPSPGSPGLRA
eukprot:7349437-Prymnesium_polylepis.1